MKTKNVVIISIISFAVVCISAGWFMYNKGPLNIHSVNGIEVSAEDLYATFEKDTSTALKLYNNKIVVVSGVIEKIQTNNEQAQVILLNTSENGAYINCTMDETKPF